MREVDLTIHSHQRGFALPMALIILSTLIVMSLGLSRMARSHLEFATEQKSSLNDEFLVYNTFQQLLFTMLSGHNEVATLHAGKTTLPLDGRWTKFVGVWIKLQDRNGLYPLQAAPGVLIPLLERYLSKPEANLLAMRIADWIDADSLPRIGGMERADYVSAGLYSVPRNGPMRSLNELFEIPGITDRIYQGDSQAELLGLRDLLVLQVMLPGFNVATAPAALLGPVLNLPESDVMQILQTREKKNWAGVKAIVGPQRFGEEISLIAGTEYTVVIRTSSGRKARIGVRLTPASSKPYKILSWYYPDYER